MGDVVDFIGPDTPPPTERKRVQLFGVFLHHDLAASDWQASAPELGKLGLTEMSDGSWRETGTGTPVDIIDGPVGPLIWCLIQNERFAFLPNELHRLVEAGLISDFRAAALLEMTVKSVAASLAK